MPKKILRNIDPKSYLREKIQYINPDSKMEHTERINVSLEEFEALRLYYYRKFTQSEAAEQFNVSQPTFSRILNSGTEKIVQAIVEGKDFEIVGGNVSYEEWNGYFCWDCEYEWINKDIQRIKENNQPEKCPKCGKLYFFPLKKIVASFS